MRWIREDDIHSSAASLSQCNLAAYHIHIIDIQQAGLADQFRIDRMGEAGSIEIICEDVEISPNKRSSWIVELLESVLHTIVVHISYSFIQKGDNLVRRSGLIGSYT